MAAVALTCLIPLLGGCAVHHRMTPLPPDSLANPEETTFHWFGPMDPGDRGWLERWQAYVGPELFHAAPRKVGAPLPAPDRVRVVTWNIDVGAGDLIAFLDAELDHPCDFGGPERTPAQPFVLLIQEAGRVLEDARPVRDARLTSTRRTHRPRPHGDPDIVEVARRCGLDLAYVPASRNGVDVAALPARDKGNAILSTVPLSDPFAIELPFETERKVAVGATIRLSGPQKLLLVNAHLEVSTTLRRVLMTGGATRLRQVEGLLEALRLAGSHGDGGPRPTLLGGDMNTMSNFEATLTALRDAFPDSPPGDGLNTTGPLPADHIFFRTGPGGRVELVPGTYRRIDAVYSSDHRARSVWVRVTPAPAASDVNPHPLRSDSGSSG